jgi:hypothetical protein
MCRAEREAETELPVDGARITSTGGVSTQPVHDSRETWLAGRSERLLRLESQTHAVAPDFLAPVLVEFVAAKCNLVRSWLV